MHRKNTVDAGTRMLNCRRQGAGPPLILLHGLFGSLTNWLAVGRRLAVHFSVYAVDLRNHGDSFHSTDCSLAAMAGDVRVFMAAHGLKRATLVGHSLGGKVAMQFAASYPRQVTCLVVVDMAPRAYAPALEDIFDGLLAVDLKSCGTLKDVVAALAEHIPDRMTRRFLAKNLARGSDGRLYWKINLPAMAAGRREVYRAVDIDHPIGCPALFVRGEDSDHVTEDDRGPIRRLFPRSQVVSVPRAGHFVHIDAPKTFCRVLLDFLFEKCDDGG